MAKSQSKTTVLLAILGAWAFILRLIELPIFPPAQFLKFDFSDLVVLVGMLVKGPVGLLAVAFIRDFLHYLFFGGEAGIPIGMMMSMAASLALFIPSHFFLSKGKSLAPKMRYLLMGVVSTLTLTVVMLLFNYFIAVPLYTKVLHFPIDNIRDYLLLILVPFNLLKGLINSVGQVFVIKVFYPQLFKRNVLYEEYIQASL
ncbi:ECF transporter S component [Suicoccus acidiformans]|uniref:Riboflavin transporter n=1 Tax=Suicoccus acidiformans TaxID=2036206 RepID=A0A347WL93_9LACT|nr:ECF transporter S component [Suicoccus acidiformans]AXY25850.1 ECF transporter S component [Suicoccus acidiformans]